MGGVAGDRAEALRDQLVDGLMASGAIRTEPVAAAFRAVPRHLFLPGLDLDVVYADDAVVTKWSPDGRPVSSSSQPAIMALMLEQLGLRPGQRVLEVGAGTGYNAALVGHLVGPGGAVVTVDLDEDLVARARDNLDRAGASGVTVVCGDGAEGWAPGAPYDRIIVTAGAWDVAPAWRDQLTAGGRIVLPLSLRGEQRSVAFEAVGDRLEAVSIVDCGFMPLRGVMAEPGGPRMLGDQPGLFVYVDDDRPLDTTALFAALAAPGDMVPTGIRLTTRELSGLILWLALHEPAVGGLSAIGPAVRLGLVPALRCYPGQAMTTALLGDTGLAALVRVPGDGPASGGPASHDVTSGPVSGDTGSGGPASSVGAPSGGSPSGGPAGAGPASGAHRTLGAGPFDLGVRGFGVGGQALADRLAAQARAWDAHGRPATRDLRLTAYPPTTSRNGLTGTVLDKLHTRLELRWSPPDG